LSSEKYSQIWQQINGYLTENKPLIHQITNYVTAADSASIVLNWGALPVMASFPAESAEFTAEAAALVLNLGTLSRNRLDAVFKAVDKAEEKGIPIILDPVGVGAAEFRTKSAEKIIREVKLDIIKGNKAEITALSGRKAELKGVESIGEYLNIEKTAQELSQKTGAVVVVTSESDLSVLEAKLYNIKGGHRIMGETLGTGCMLASTLGVFAAAARALKIKMIDAVNTALYYYSHIGEKAAKKENTPLKFKQEFLDSIYLLTNSTFTA